MASGIQSAAGLQLSDGFVELAMEEHTMTKQEFLALGYDPEVSPADYIKVGGVESGTCTSCRGECAAMLAARGMPDDGRAPHHAWPTVCQSYDARVQGSLCPDPANPTGPRSRVPLRIVRRRPQTSCTRPWPSGPLPCSIRIPVTARTRSSRITLVADRVSAATLSPGSATALQALRQLNALQN